MSLNHILEGGVPPKQNLHVNNLAVDGILSATFTPSALTIAEQTNASVVNPPAGFQTFFADASFNRNATLKTSVGDLLSLGSSVSRFIVGVPSSNLKYTSIQDAIDAASLTGDLETVVVTPGVYTQDIDLKANVFLLGVQGNSPFASNTPVSIVGRVTGTYNGLSSLSNLQIFSVAGFDAINVTGTGGFFASNCQISCIGAGVACLVVNNVNLTLNLDNVALTHYTPNETVLKIDNCNTSIIRFCNIFNNSGTGGNVVMNGGNNIFTQNIIFVTTQVNGAGTTYSGIGNLNQAGDEPVITMSGGSNSNQITCTYVSDTTSGTDFITGLGTFNRSLITLLGRTTIGAGITDNPIPNLL